MQLLLTLYENNLVVAFFFSKSVYIFSSQRHFFERPLCVFFLTLAFLAISLRMTCM